jgi:hypothetical protein
MKRVLGIVLGVAAVFGMKMYNKGAAASDVKSHLVRVCDGETACVDAVNQNFDACFEQAYKMGGRRRSSRLDSKQLASCLNDKAGQPYFEVEPEK